MVQHDSTVNGSGGAQVKGERIKAEKHDQRSVSSEQEVENDLPNTPAIHSNSPAPDTSSAKGALNLKSAQNGLDDLCQAFDRLKGSTGAQRVTHQRTESPYMRALHEGLGTMDGHSNRPILLHGMQPVEARGGREAGSEAEAAVSTVTWDLDEEIAYAMHTATHNSRALEPRTIAEAQKQANWP